MSIDELLKKLRENQVQIRVNDGKLLCDFPKGTVDDILKNQLLKNKEAIKNYIQQLTENHTLPDISARQLSEAPLSYGQQRLWFIDQMQEGSPEYNIPVVLHVEGLFNVKVAQQAITHIIQRHETIRTVFEERQGIAVQLIKESFHFKLHYHDLSGLNKKQQDSQLTEIINKDSSNVFNLSTDLMIRASYIRLSDNHEKVLPGILLINMHHIASDGWSFNLLIKEFNQLYAAFSQGKENPLPPLPIQYADYTCWQRQWLQGEVLNKQLAYWKNQLLDSPQMHNLPLDKPRPAQQKINGNCNKQVINQKITNRIHELCYQQDVTLFMFLQTVFSVLLSRYSNEVDIVMGSPNAGRTHKDLESLIGFFVNTLVLRSNLSANPEFETLLKNNKKMILDAYSYQHTPFEMLVEELQPKRSISHNPIFQILFTLQNNEISEFDLPGLTLKLVEQNNHIVTCDLDLSIQELQNELILYWSYNTDLFNPDSISRMADSFIVLLGSILSNTKQSIQFLPLLSPEELHYLSVDWNNSLMDYPELLGIHELFEMQVNLNPDSVAVDYEGKEITYLELNQLSNQLAHYLKSLGVDQGTMLGICLKSSIEMIIGILASLKTGGIYIPLDPNYPKIRLQYMLEDSGLKYLLTKFDLNITFTLTDDVTVIELDSDIYQQQLQAQPITNPIPTKTYHADNPAYVIYTSGSTGQAKGLIVSHGNWLSFQSEIQKPYKIRSSDRVLQFSSISFDIFIEEMSISLLSGGCLVLVDNTYSPTCSEFWSRIRHYNISIVSLTTAYWHQLCADVNLSQDSKNTSLRLLITGGEAMSAGCLQGWKCQADYSIQLLNTYGPTETTVIVSYYDTSAYKDKYRTVPIGQILANSYVLLLDSYQLVVPTGVIGELCIGGNSVGTGYLNRPQLTREKFIQNPYSTIAPDYLYKTGDLVRYLTDGHLEYIGRMDNQVKIRGFRIELDEIENCLSQITVIHEAVVKAWEKGNRDKYLVAYINLKKINDGESQFDLINNIKLELKTKLPDYMLPSFIIVLHELPLTPNGKIDRKALPSPDENDFQKAEYVAPSNDIEEKLCSIWKTVLNLNQIGVNDNFFELGGDSILSIQLISKAKLLGCHFTVRDLFENQTITTLALVAGSNLKMETQQFAVEGDMPLLPIQSSFFSLRLPEQHHYNQSVLLQTPLEFTLIHLKAIVAAIYKRHDAVRLRFTQGNDEQWIATHEYYTDHMLQASLRYYDLSTYSNTLKKKRLEILCNDTQASFDITNGPLLKAVYFDYGNERGRLLLVIHHLVVDGVSWRILLSDMELAYQQLQYNQPIKLSSKTTSYQHWGKSLHTYGISDVLGIEKDYWLALLSKPLHPLPACVNYKNALNKPQLHNVTLQLSEGETAYLLGPCHKAYHTHISELLLSALLMAYQYWTKQSVMCIQLEGHGREELFKQLDISETVGWFTSLYPLILEAELNSDIGELIKTVKEQYRQIPQHGIGYGILKELIKDPQINSMENDIHRGSIVFNYLGQFDNTPNNEMLFSMATESAGLSQSQHQQQPELISLNGSSFGGCLSFAFSFDSCRITVKSVNHFVDAYKKALQAVIRHCQSTIVDDVGLTDNIQSTGNLSNNYLSHEYVIDTNAQKVLANEIIIIKMNNSVENYNLFCIHPIEGTVSCYANLANGLVDFGTFYGLQMPHLFSDDQMISIKRLAEYYLSLIRSIQSSGPYYLLGWSLGGILAYEVASQMEKQGESIIYLGLFDQPPVMHRQHYTGQKREWFDLIKKHLPENIAIDWDELKDQSPYIAIELITQKAMEQNLQFENFTQGLVKRYLHYLYHLDHCLRDYSSPVSEIHIDLFKAEKNDNKLIDNIEYKEDYDWKKFTSGNVTVIQADGTHADMMRLPYIKRLLSKLKLRLRMHTTRYSEVTSTDNSQGSGIKNEARKSTS